MADTSKETKAPQQSPKDKPKQDKPAFVREKGRGIVKSVLSGDTIVVLHMAQQGPPVERQITLSSLQAPMLGRRKTKTQPATQDEPFAWSAREFLRKKVIGKNISYTIEFKTPTGREYGVVTLANNSTGEQESIAPSVVENGWAKVKRPANPPKDGLRPELQQLVDLEEQAKKSEKGIWNTNPDDLEHSKRPLDAESNCAVIYEQFKGKAITGVVESVRSGSSFRVTLLPSFAEVMLYLSGAQAPEPVGEGEFEPFGRESRFFTEHHILNREVQILLEGVDKFNCYGTVSYLGRNVAEELLKNGLGRYVDWSGSRTKAVDALKAAEKDAKEKNIRIWSVPATKVVGQDGKVQTSSPASSKPGKEIYGKVVEVINGSTIVVQDQGGHEHKINLSSIEVPRLLPPKKEDSKKEEMVAVDNKKDNKTKEKKLTKEAVERAYAMEAKELLRKRVIGQKVKCLYDYTLASTPAQAQAPPQQNKQGPLPDRVYYSVYIDKNNVGVELTEAGFASARVHKGGEQRSRDYETILLAEDRAKKLNKGIHGSPDKAPVLHINDISQLEPAKAKQFLPHLKRHGKQRGVVEFEFSGSRVKLYVPKESASIIFSLAAVSAPRKTEPLGAEGYAFTRDVAHQRDVEFEILSQDKNGTFVGNLWVNKKNLATLLLEQGFAETYSSVRESEHQAEYLIAEESAKRAKKGLWKDYDEVAEAQKRKKAHEDNEERRKPKQEFIEILVTEIIDGSKFYVQIVGKDTEQLDKLMKDLSTETSETPYNPKVDELVKAQFEDDAWYRAKVKAKVAEGEYEIFYIDFGNSEVISNARLRPLEHSFTTLPPQAVEAQLAYIRAPSLDEDYGPDAAVKLRDLVYGKQMLANIEYRDSDRIYLSLGDRESQIYVNAAMLREGLARVEKVRGRSANQLVEKLREEEDKARASHAFIWEYGDPGFDDEEEKLPAKKPVPVTKKDAKEAANKK